jgi:hypothetical protein
LTFKTEGDAGFDDEVMGEDVHENDEVEFSTLFDTL